MKAILGDDLFKQVQDKVNAYNGDEANKDKQLKIADLGSGEYVSKAKYASLEAENQTNTTKLTEANTLIDRLKNSGAVIDDLQKRIDDLNSEIKSVKVDSALKAAFVRAKVSNPDYIRYKLKGDFESFELDDQGEIKGITDLLAGLITQYPKSFNKHNSGKYEGFHIEAPNYPYNGFTKSQLMKMPYSKHLEIFNNNPDQYNKIMKS